MTTEEQDLAYIRARNDLKREFVDSGFITINQWRNFIDYLQILLKKEKEK